MIPELESLPDDKLSEVFAVECRGWTYKGGCWFDSDREMVWNYEEDRCDLPKFSKSADAVLPFLEKAPFVTMGQTDSGWYVSINDGEHYAASSTPPRAACICLIEYERAKKGSA